MISITRRLFGATTAVGAASTLAGCMGSGLPGLGGLFGDGEDRSGPVADYATLYGANTGEPFPVQAFRYESVPAQFLRRDVAYEGPEDPGTIVVDPAAHYLYLVGRRKRATRYGVGVGREGFGWRGIAQINMRRSWPDWVPPREMVERDPDVRAQLVSTSRGPGVPGGPRSPLGARAMYLFAKGVGDTGYRIHGTTEPETIGTSVSSGCIRMVNQDIIHLYGRAPDGTNVVVLAG